LLLTGLPCASGGQQGRVIAKELIAAAAAATGYHLVLSYSDGELLCTCQEPMPEPDGGEQLVVRASAPDPGPVTVSELEMLAGALPLVQDTLRQLGLYDAALAHVRQG
jgi:hypothetical protein